MSKARYLRYKPSKTLWLKEIPEHWQETDIRMLFLENKTKNDGLTEKNLLSLSYGKLKRKDIDSATGLVPASFEGYQVIEDGYIILRFTDLQNDKKSLRVGYCPEIGIITNAYVGLAPKEGVFSKYYYYLLHYLDKIKYFYNLGGGVRQSLSFKEFGRETVLVPDEDEQKNIARFLDYKLAKIERFIRKKKQLIKLLKEQKAAIINRAVTKGLDANVAMKDSGFEWLGEIPEHWEVKKLKWVARTNSGSTPNSSNQAEYYDGDIPWIRTLDLNNGEVIDTELKITEKALAETSCKINPVNTVMVAMYGGAGTIGKSGIARLVATTNQAVCCILPNENFNSDYLHNYIKFYRPYWMIGAEGTRKDPNISQDDIRNLHVVFPPIQEQVQVVDFINQEIEIIHTTISKIEREITLTEEYRTALIAEAVTGKIDVRAYAIPDTDSYLQETEEESDGDLAEEISLAAEDAEAYLTEELEE